MLNNSGFLPIMAQSQTRHILYNSDHINGPQFTFAISMKSSLAPSQNLDFPVRCLEKSDPKFFSQMVVWKIILNKQIQEKTTPTTFSLKPISTYTPVDLKIFLEAPRPVLLWQVWPGMKKNIHTLFDVSKKIRSTSCTSILKVSRSFRISTRAFIAGLFLRRFVRNLEDPTKGLYKMVFERDHFWSADSGSLPEALSLVWKSKHFCGVFVYPPYHLAFHVTCLVVKARLSVDAEMYLLAFSPSCNISGNPSYSQTSKVPPTFGQTIHPSFDEIGCNKLPAFGESHVHVSQKMKKWLMVQRFRNQAFSSWNIIYIYYRYNGRFTVVS